MKSIQEYAIYKGDELVMIGTAEECAAELDVSKEYVQWLTTPTAKRRLENRKHPENCTVAIKV